MLLLLSCLVFLNILTVSGFNLSYTLGLKMYNNDSITEVFDCLSNVLRTYFDRRPICLYFNELNSIDSFAKTVQSPIVIIPYSSFNNTYQQTNYSVFTFLAEDGLYEQLLNIKHQTYFVAIWTKQVPMNQVRRVFQNFWMNGKHVNIVGLMEMDDGAVNVYTYKPFSNYGCNKLGRPFLLDRWKNGSFRSLGTVDLFSHKTKTGNMHRCLLKCVGNEYPPDAVMRYDGKQWTMSGVGGIVLDIVAKHINFTPMIISPKNNYVNEMYSWFNSDEVLNNITDMLHTGEADLAFGWYSFATNHIEDNTKLARATSVDCLGWAVPYRAGPTPQPWTNYVFEFDQIGWLFIGSIFLIVTGVFNFFNKLKKLHRVDSVAFFVYHTAIDQPFRVQPTWCSLRTFMIHWLWYCMVINVAYKASLGSFMTVPPHGLEFTSMDEILKSYLITMASPRSLNIMNATTSTTQISRKFMKRLQLLPPISFERVIDRMIMDRDIAVFEIKRFMYYYSKSQAKRLKVKIPMRFLPGCLLRTHTTQFMFNESSYLTESVDTVLSTLFETGIVDHWVSHLGSNKILPLEKIRGKVLQLHRLKEPFLFLFFSYAIAFVVLVGEICWFKKLHHRLLFFLFSIQLFKKNTRSTCSATTTNT